MEPAPVSDTDLDIASDPDNQYRDETRTMAPGGEYLTAVSPVGVDDIEELDSEELELELDVVEPGDEAALPVTDLDKSDSAPTLRPARAPWSAAGITRSKLIALGALAFSAGILTSAGARGLVLRPLRSTQASAPAAIVSPVVTVDHEVAATPPDPTVAAAVVPPAAATTPATVTSAVTATPPVAATPPGEAAPVPSSAIPDEPTAKEPSAMSEPRRRRSGAAHPRASRRAEPRHVDSSAGAAAAAASPDEPKAPAAAAPGRAAPWLDPFVE